MHSDTIRGNAVNTRPKWWPVVVFWAIFLVLLWLIQTVCLNKGNATELGWTLSNRFTRYDIISPIDGFYDLPKESADVVFIGSSIAYCAANPNVIFREYGYSSYNFSTGMMGMNLSLCYLEEALRVQRPKAVVMEATLLAPFFAEDVNCGYRATVSYFPLCKAKLRFVEKLPSFDEAAGMLLTIYSMHARWKDIGASDFSYLFADRKNPLLGFVGREVVYIRRAYTDYAARFPDDARDDDIAPTVKSFIADAQALCEQYGSELIFVTMPSADGTLPIIYPFFNTLSDYLAARQIPYVNYNLQKERIGLTAADIMDERHLTVSGATKFSRVIGADLQKMLSLPDNRNNPDYAYYADCCETYVNTIQSIPDREALNAF